MTQEQKYILLKMPTSGYKTAVELCAYMSGYLDALKWADHTMIDKANKWISAYDPNDYIIDDDDYYGLDEEKIINDFKKAMER